jgi:ketosteroid isomerase-like protein
MGANADVVRSFWEAFGRRNFDDAIAHVDEEAEIVVPETVPWGGAYRGPDGFRKMMVGVTGLFEEFRPQPEAFIEGEDDNVVVRSTSTVARSRAESSWAARSGSTAPGTARSLGRRPSWTPRGRAKRWVSRHGAQ